MAGSVNKVTLLGRLGNDPEVVSMNDGGKIVKFSVATSERWKDRNTGEQRERTEWHRVVIFNENLGRIAEEYLRKGSMVYLEGQMQTRKWQDQSSGQDRYTTEVVLARFRGELTMVGGRNEGGSASSLPADDGAGQGGAAPSSAPPPMSKGEDGDIDDDIPF